jgi:hypothetical protein
MGSVLGLPSFDNKIVLVTQGVRQEDCLTTVSAFEAGFTAAGTSFEGPVDLSLQVGAKVGSFFGRKKTEFP